MRAFRKRQTFVVERRALGLPQAQPTLTLRDLPVPPAANTLFFNAERGRSRSGRYHAWRSAAGWQARLQSPRRVRGPVAITITIEEGSRADLDNLAKAPIDLLCELNLIEGDHRDVIREVNLRWGSSPGLVIEVRPAT